MLPCFHGSIPSSGQAPGVMHLLQKKPLPPLANGRAVIAPVLLQIAGASGGGAG